MAAEISSSIQAELQALSLADQAKVLEFARSLKGVQNNLPETALRTGATLAEAAREAGFSAEDLCEIAQSIEAGCNQVDSDEW